MPMAMPLDDWRLASLAAGAAGDPAAALALVPADGWLPARGALTVGAALRAAGRLDLERPVDLDARDWWWRCRFTVHDAAGARVLRLGGLATLCDAWLDGRHLLASESMWLAHEVDLGDGLAPGEHELVLRFAALAGGWAGRRGRPRWRTRLVEPQGLRWLRTTLLGRMPGWTPPVAVVGPFRGVALAGREPATLVAPRLRATRRDGEQHLRLDARVALAGGVRLAGATLRCGGLAAPARLVDDDGGARLAATLRADTLAPWWPHTHGTPALHEASLALVVDGAEQVVPLGRVGFRELAVDRGADGEGFALRVNGIPVFCRGACWMPLDVASLDADADAYARALAQVTDAGFTMLRVSGATAYESGAFHDACDAAGVLVWQDFMFANMDYPVADAGWRALVEAEARQLLARLAHRPSLAVLCGGSEVAQQAAMLGLAPEAWSGPLFDALLPALCAELAPDVPWVANSPSGGDLPFTARQGVTHYYGVGAYLRPPDDARRAGVRFASECLGFANVPEPSTVELVTTPAEPAPHHPRWKARVPRDRGAGWDFEDVRDHYQREVLGADPLRARYADVERYLALSRVASGHVMAQAMAEWRRPGSGCGGALVWTHRDLWPGAGWGLVDSTGLPKAAYWMLRRACLPVALAVTDEGVNGLALHAHNDRGEPLDAELALVCWRGGAVTAEARAPLALPPHGARTVWADALLGRFTDAAYAYRFGPPAHDLVVATLRDRAAGRVLAEAFHFPLGLPLEPRDDVLAAAECERDASGAWRLRVRAGAQGPAVAVAVEVDGWVPEDAYFHLAPGAQRELLLRGGAEGATPKGSVRPLNAREGTRLAPRDAARAAWAPAGGARP